MKDGIASPSRVERRLGVKGADAVLAVYFIAGMGHGGAEYDQMIGAQLDALEQWIDFCQSGGKHGAPPPASLGKYPRDSSPHEIK